VRDYPTEIFHDFRHYYTVSAEKIGTAECSWNEAIRLIEALRTHPESMLVVKLSGMDRPASRIEILLIQIQHTLVDLLTVQIGKKDRQSALKLKLPLPQLIKSQKKRVISKKEFNRKLAFSRVAEPTQKEE
jgi:hypothetical protein